MKRITCEDLALGIACKRILEAETDDEVVDAAIAHARDEHEAQELDRERVRTLIAAPD